MTTRVSATKEIFAPRERVFDLLLDTEKRLRFHPSWEELKVEKLTPGEVREGTEYRVFIRMEDAEEGVEYTLKLKEIEKPERLVLETPSRTMTYTLKEKGHATELEQEDIYGKGLEERMAEKAEEDIRLWLHGLKHYCELRANPLARVSKFIVDKVMLRIPPVQRRIVFYIVVFNILLMVSVILAIVVLVVANYFNMELFK